MPVKNKVQLITYPDSLGGDLKTLNEVLHQHFPNAFPGGLHILPPFPSSGDRGFAPLTYLEIEPAFGTWADVERLSENHPILLDLMVNHISRQSPFFQDFLQHGRQSPYDDMFLTLDKLWPGGIPAPEDLDRLFLRRVQPYSTYMIQATGEPVTVWTTFGRDTPSEQIDLDVRAAVTRRLLLEFLAEFSQHGVSIVRLDAVAYVIKRPGTSCFMVEPEIYDFLGWISQQANRLGIELLPEVHAPYATQFSLAGHGYWIYDFALPYLILELLITGNSARLRDYLRLRPARQFTMLDCHDGIPVKPDLDGLVSTQEARRVVEHCVARGANLSLLFSPTHYAPDGFDVHQINGSYYSMLDGDADAYLAARAIQFFVPGVPQVYYAGLLAAKNDTQRVEQTGEGREINRPNFTWEEIEQAVQQDVVQRLKRLIRFRNEHPAFDGEFEIMPTRDDRLALRWTRGDQRCTLQVDLHRRAAVIEHTTAGSPEMHVYRV